MARTAKKVPFETAVAELEQIAAVLEKGDVTLDEMIEQYTKGMKLIKSCSEQLEKSQAAIDKLLTVEQGKIREQPLVMEEDE